MRQSFHEHFIKIFEITRAPLASSDALEKWVISAQIDGYRYVTYARRWYKNSSNEVLLLHEVHILHKNNYIHAENIKNWAHRAQKEGLRRVVYQRGVLSSSILDEDCADFFGITDFVRIEKNSQDFQFTPEDVIGWRWNQLRERFGDQTSLVEEISRMEKVLDAVAESNADFELDYHHLEHERNIIEYKREWDAYTNQDEIQRDLLREMERMVENLGKSDLFNYGDGLSDR